MAASLKPTLRIERTFDCAPEAVWAAWTEPAHIAAWWNPSPGRGAEVHEVDARPGGRLRLTMTVPEASDILGTDTFTVLGTFVTVRRPHELEITLSDGDTLEEHTVTVRFEAVKSRTRMTFEVFGDPGEIHREGMEEGWNLCLDKLTDHVDEGTAGRQIVMTRTFDAPRERVFDAWTDPTQVAQWWGPDGFTSTIHEMDARPGGVWRLTMHGPDGTDYPNRIAFDEVRRPSRLAYTHGTNEQHPDEFRVRVTFEEDGAGTRLTMRMRFPSVEEMERVKKFGAEDGMKQTLGRLAQHLAIA